MPPRSAKKTPPGPRSKRAVRGRVAVKVDELPEESNVKAEEEVEFKDEEIIEEDEKPPIDTDEKETDLEEIVNKQENGSEKKDTDAKEPVDEYERDERLDFDDNDPEYEPEEYAGLDYDEKEIEPQEEGYEEVEEEIEEGDVVEVEEEENDELRAEEHHSVMVDAVEDQEHHELVNERRKRKEFEIFVGGLDKDATESDLRKVFGEVGEITEIRLLMNPQTKRNKGFAFLRFATVEQAKQACTLKNPVVHGKPCGVTPSQDSDTLFLGNICRTWTKEAVKEKLRHYGVDNIEDLTLGEDNSNVGTNWGSAFLEFSSRADAMDAFKRLQKRDIVFGLDRPAKVSFADSFIDPGDEIMAQVKTLFIDGLSASWDEDRVKELLKKYGDIEKIELARNMPSARRRDFGFVTFDTHEAAVTCAKSINNEEVGEGDNKVKVRARLSRPLHRGKGNYASRGDFRPARGPTRVSRRPNVGPDPRSLRGSRRSGPRLPPVVHRGFKRPAPVIRERRQVTALPPRNRPVAAPLPRSYDRRPPVPSYSKRGSDREYAHREEILPRSRPTIDYSSRAPQRSRPAIDYSSRVPQRSSRTAIDYSSRVTHRDDYSPRGPDYPDFPRGGPSRSTARRVDVDDGYNQRYERPPQAYREGHRREYDSFSGSKRPYPVDDVPPRYGESGVRHSRARLDYEVESGASHYGDAYSDRLRRSSLGYGESRSTLSSQDSYGLYSGRDAMGYSGGSYGGSEVSGMYSSSYSGDYMSRGSDVGGGSYSSLYPGRGLGGSSYMGSGGSGSGSGSGSYY